MKKKIIITGGTGLLGKHLVPKLKSENYLVDVFSTDPEKAKQILPFADKFTYWDYKDPNTFNSELSETDIIIHLSGANLAGKRWSADYKKEIIESRTISTKNLVDAISKQSRRPELFICASGAGYYGDRANESLTEDSISGSDFLSDVCVKWEEEAARIEEIKVRRISLRTATVLSPKGGALEKLVKPYKFLVGGPLGPGKQYFPWIHIDDWVAAVLFIINNQNLNGPVNLSSPEHDSMYKFSETIAGVLDKPSRFDVSTSILKLVVGEMAETITNSEKVVPKKLMDAGFEFKYPNLFKALLNLLSDF